MPVSVDKPGPYASPQSIIEIVERHRDRGLPSPVNSEVLGRAGIPDSLIPRTLQAMQTLDLIDESGNITEMFESIRLAPEAEYQTRMQAWLNSAYADVLAYLDPANDDETKIRDAFRNYRPTGQQGRMVTLFTRLYAAAGVRAPKPPPVKAAAPRTRTVRNNVPAVRKAPPQRTPTPQAYQPPTNALPTPIEGLLATLPSEGSGWTKERRDKFVTTFEAVLDFCFPIESTALVRTTENGD
ncbi:MAG: DUF5343 domain-containing protein [Sphingomicrobium sp.]